MADTSWVDPEWFVYLSVIQHGGTRSSDREREIGGYIWGPFGGRGGEAQARYFISLRGGLLMGPFKAKRRPKMERTPYSDELAEQWMNALHDNVMLKEPLSPWELQFLESIADQYGRRGSLSPKQFEILEKIYAGKTK